MTNAAHSLPIERVVENGDEISRQITAVCPEQKILSLIKEIVTKVCTVGQLMEDSRLEILMTWKACTVL